MQHQAKRPSALMLSLLLVMAMPARAGVLQFADVVYAPNGASTGASTDARLRIAPQSGNSTIIAQQSGQGSGAPATQQPGVNNPNAPAGGSSTDTTLSQSGGQVETVDLGDVTGTVCDCGEIPSIPEIPGGIFPFWPFIAAVPLICVTGICKPGDDEVTPVPPSGCIVNCGTTPQTPQTPVPEPASLLLFGTSLLALGAGARRRFSRSDKRAQTTAAGEVI